MTQFLSVEDWVAAVLAFIDELTVDDLVALRLDAAQRALLAPAAAVGGVDLFPDIHEKAAALLSEMLHQEPIGEEHLRAVASWSAMVFLADNGHYWDPSPTELPYWIAEAHQGRLSVRTLATAIRNECTTVAEDGMATDCRPSP
ncbi:MAG: hypothetical protein ACJ735_02760 [Actinomycetes bacterium]